MSAKINKTFSSLSRCRFKLEGGLLSSACTVSNNLYTSSWCAQKNCSRNKLESSWTCLTKSLTAWCNDERCFKVSLSSLILDESVISLMFEQNFIISATAMNRAFKMLRLSSGCASSKLFLNARKAVEKIGRISMSLGFNNCWSCCTKSWWKSESLFKYHCRVSNASLPSSDRCGNGWPGE